MDNLPRVSVLMLAYNHDRFIGQAIESVVSQECDFPIELIIGEDCSTDDTRQICQQYAVRHPDKIQLMLHESNVGALENAKRVYDSCRGEYLAVCEGDDYWTDRRKLDRQVAALDAHSHWSACYHRVRVLFEDAAGDETFFPTVVPGEELTLEQLAAENCVSTCSVMYRRQLVPELPDWFLKLQLADWPLNILYASHGPFGYLNDVMSVYRRHAGGMWSTLNFASAFEHSLRALFELEAQCEESIRPVIVAGRREFIGRNIRSYDEELVRLRKIESRYRSLRLHQIAALGKWLKSLVGH
ncbi:MAG: glycosyltransferase [Planctomycetes bacterium]|nr:glycosyltransferase [Planctomycetota bacterium]